MLISVICCGYVFAEAQQLHLPERWRLENAQPIKGRDTLTIRILGDMMMHYSQIMNALQGDGSYRFDCFRFIKDKIAESDIAIANMEFTLAGEPYTGYPTFSAPDSFAEYLAECGFDIFLTANNHILDKGSEGAARTLMVYESLGKSHGIRHTGTYADQAQKDSLFPLMICRKGYRLALLNMTYGTNLGSTAKWPEVSCIGSANDIMQAMKRAEAKAADAILAFPHWGNEYVLQHSASQEETAAWLAAGGADAVIGAHPHVVQDFQFMGERNVPVAYSLGNAVSNMSAANTQIGLMATIRITRDDQGNTVMLPIEFTYLWCSRPGGYTDMYMVLPVKDFIGTADDWKGRWEYEKMIETYYNVKSETGIESE